MWLRLRDDDDGADTITNYRDPSKELNLGLWMLFAGAAVLLGLRVWVKITRRHGLWYDDYILITSWFVLLANDALISHEYATGYVTQNGTKWDDRMHILINITSCGTLIGQALTKTAFGVTLLKLSNKWQQYVLWFCIASMNAYMVAKVFLQWGKLCDDDSYDVYYRLDFCVGKKWRDDFKEGGNVYNIIMDFVFALFPWIITWKLDMRKNEKIGLCVTMSLGMVVAVVSAIRTGWKDSGNKRDPDYYWRNAMSNIWYSSEVAGTIMVQCIPVLRPFLRDVTTSLTSKRIPSKSYKSYEPSPLSRTWESSRIRFSKAPTLSLDQSIDQSSVGGFNFDFKEARVTNTAGIELRPMSPGERDVEKLMDMSDRGRGEPLKSIVEESDEEWPRPGKY
ncbi:hypothetical protein K458DRAFT_363594 [Lentithecium fluviatile CBS 122367]|uniref:Rhodopsin domain-containing protein n=1 Tax=Lentithecium fluviatile CBS 122367 TaxID=1168545 RepID=A0A6G1J676_9PLEO|nr:hypothetical protein K458DRAFT_363594 [Lentithecium fluviatile CBS 122367]